MPHADPLAHGAHVLTVCNACRYCEQFCPVFPAMEQRVVFERVDLAYLANLCHNCGECLYACQYAPPHEFGINVPRTLAEIRLDVLRALRLAAAAGRADAPQRPAHHRRPGGGVHGAVLCRLGPHRRRRGVARAAGRRLLRGGAARRHGRGVRERLCLRRAGARHRRRPVCGRRPPIERRGRAVSGRRPRLACDQGRADAAPSARRGRRLRVRRRGASPLAPVVSPLGARRLPALLRVHDRRGDLSRRVRVAGALRHHQPAGRARDARRRRSGRRFERAVGAATAGAIPRSAIRRRARATARFWLCCSRPPSRAWRCWGFAPVRRWVCC